MPLLIEETVVCPLLFRTKLNDNTGSAALARTVAAENKNKGVQVFAYATGSDDERNISDALDFVVANRKEGDSVVVYGYSRGGDAAVGLASALEKKKINVDLLVTVDSYNPDSMLLFAIGNAIGNRGLAENAAKGEASANVNVFYNFYQTNSEGQHGRVFGGKNVVNVNMSNSYHSSIDEKTSGIVNALIRGGAW